MKKAIEYSQVVVRFPIMVEKRIKRAAKKTGLTKASWLRQLAIRELEKIDGE